MHKKRFKGLNPLFSRFRGLLCSALSKGAQATIQRPTSIGAESIGVCYGMLGNNLPPPEQVVALYKANNIQMMRLYDAYDKNRDGLQALKGSNIEVMLGVPNSDLQRMAGQDLTPAYDFVYGNVVDNKDTINIKYIVVGNEVSVQDFPYVLPAMKNIQGAVEKAGLQDRVKVTTATYTGALVNTYPPSASVFSDEIRPYMQPIIAFLAQTGSPFCANIHPYFSYMLYSQNIRRDYAVFTAPSFVEEDGNLKYQNLFDAMLDSVYAAIEKIGGSSVRIVVSETGWPNVGDFASTTENAQDYLNGLIKHVKGSGTPRRPNWPIETYIFAMFDENTKPGAEPERHWGLFYPNKQPKYQLSF
ncbi:PREDICTED: glucan endo-1,3-beta-glucosidase-like [Nelumbo nucifera]|uniref:Glucan endo-1,3-beta-glucosidase-like n=2 Tax=Nelumbo nucifera TaxID=4432 RepID=A0A822ZGI0_NELNU|nr:PREDICTED: glucan endo-1,3-beta-glucosidase-like [Nelumbo nucifera]DAD42535.1 TPA_asm: hypothetical protein HUJ06_000765 [Nelumbo nucifera]